MTVMNCGVYSIKNISNGKLYIGSSRNLTKRLAEHKRTLKNNDHHSILLQRAWNKYGENSFVFEPILYCSEEMLFQYEQSILDFYVAYDPLHGYNICKDVTRPPLDSGSKRLGILHPLYGKPMPDEVKKKISESKLGKPSANLGRESKLKGTTRSPEVIAKIKATKQSKPCPYAKITKEQAIEIKRLGKSKEFSQRKLADIYNLTQSTVHLIISGKNWKNLGDNFGC